MVENMRSWHDEGLEAEICTIGAKAASFFNILGGKVVASVRNIGE
jgi:F-type H+-transporting ATPase subunit gamma